MPNLTTILKGEIARLARKEIKNAVEPLRKANAANRKEIVALKRQVSELQGQVNRQAKPSRGQPEALADGAIPRVTAKGLKSMRAKLGLSGADFARLLGTSVQSVYNWEAGKTVPRASQRVAIAGIRGLGKREAAARLNAQT